MLNLKWLCIPENLTKAAEGLISRGDSAGKITFGLNLLISLNNERKYWQVQLDKFNVAIKNNAKKKHDLEQKEHGRFLKEQKSEIEKILAEKEDQLKGVLLRLPNLPHADSPVGSEENNRVIKVVGEITSKEGPDQTQICKELNLVDFERGSKISGSGFPLYTRAAPFVRTLIDFFLTTHAREHGYLEVMPPLLVNESTMTGTGQLPKFKEDMYHCTEDDLYLIPTAEVPVTNMHADEILAEEFLPLGYCAYTPCFRREAGSYGADSKGLMRLHQFNKVELVRFCRPEESEQEHQLILQHAENIVKKLGLTYRVVELATGDLGFSAHRCYDIEVWAPSSQKWLEVSSVSNFLDFQARRANIKFRRKGKKAEFVHTLNASGLAIPRIIIAIIEQYYCTKRNVIDIPENLIEYYGSKTL